MQSRSLLQAKSRSSSSSKAKRVSGPYDAKQRSNTRRAPSASTSKAASPCSPPPTGSQSVSAHRSASARSGLPPPAVYSFSPSTSSISTPPANGTRRDSYMEYIRDKYPTFEPKNDYEILTLVGSNYRGPDSGVRSWLDNQLKIDLEFGVGCSFEEIADPEIIALCTEGFIERASAILNMRGSITGLKPKPDTQNVFRRPVPNSPYSVRLFPGSIARREYCLDFVHTRSGKPVNSPPGFEVWSTSETVTPWLGGCTMRIRSLERSFGFAETSILPGAEKFVLRDGQTCLLKRPGHKDLQFRVPLRAEGLNLDRPQVDRLDFPELV